MFKGIKKGDLVRYLLDGNVYEVEDIDNDCLYLIDWDGSIFTVTKGEFDTNITMEVNNK
jgi:hypothetical protein